MPLTLSIAAYFLAAVIIAIGGGRLRRVAVPIAIVPFVGQLGLVAVLSARSGAPTSESIDWIPSLGVSIGLRVDVLTFLLTAVVAGIGLLIVVYSDRYFSDPARRARFLAWMLVFTGGMAGIVASGELLGLFVFWEITTVASYVLIGFDDEKAEARASALQALLVTTAGGLAMLAGFVLLAIEAGTTSISVLVASPPSGTTATVALGLVFVGAFSKSAQFPFQFWLPGAMAAPTPVSAYLHSATMVKAGVVLLLFLAPGFASTGLWLVVVTGTGLVTMVIGAVAAIRQTDLKLLLAYGTVSQLGFMVALIGLGYTAAALAVLVAHALFKAALFLIVGVVDKGSGTRDVRKLTGVAQRYPVTAVAGAVAAASMAGIPPALGFVTKEAALDLLISDQRWFALATIASASVLTVAYAVRWWFGAFGTKPDIDAPHFRPVAKLMIVPPVVLAVLTVLFGMFPGPIAEAVAESAGQQVKLVLWPGFKPALALSAVVTILGGGLYLALGSVGFDRLPTASSLHLPRGSTIYQRSVRLLTTTADVVTGVVQNGSLPVYLAVILMSVLFVPAVTWAFEWDALISLPGWNTPVEVVLAAIVIAAAIVATRVQRRMAAVLLLGVVGYAVAGVYVVFSAPDLALTQLLIETLTVALFALVLVKLPRRFGRSPRSLSRATRILVSVFVGGFITVAALATSSVDPDRSLVDVYIAEAPEAGGTNVVNIILTNFRALDTLGEITVLAAAAVGITGLVGASRSRAKKEAA